MRRSGFTLIELLVVIAVIAVLAALLFAVFSSTREKARQTTCVSNLKQLGAALQLYTDDYDTEFPLSCWGGGIQAYVKNTQVYVCPDDGNRNRAYKGATLYVNSYALNSNLLYTGRSTDVVATAQTVQLFEVTQCNAELQDPFEGLGDAKAHPPQISGYGEGTDSGLITIGPATGDPEPPQPLYATGLLDNHHNNGPGIFGFVTDTGRHSGGSNFLAVDGHVKWLRGAQVSAGEDAFSSHDDQKPTGCPYHGILYNSSQNNEPCAAGSANGKHALTFSIK